MATHAVTGSPWNVETLHDALPGRTRFRVRGLRANAEMSRQCARNLRSLRGVSGVDVSAATGTLLVRHDAQESSTHLQHRIAAALSELVGKTVSTESRSNASARYNSSQHPARLVVEWLARNERAAAAPGRQTVLRWHAMSVEDVLQSLETDAHSGLKSAEAKRRRKASGGNRLPSLDSPSTAEMWLRQFMTLPVGVLTLSGGVALATGGVVDAAAIALVTIVNSIVGFRTERSSERIIAALASGTPKTVQVRRGGKTRSCPVSDLVPGDIIPLRPGSWVPADARIVENHHLMADESALTGESMPASKQARHVCPAGIPLADRRNMVFSGTTVTGGSGRAVVVATGRYSELGKVQDMAGRLEAPDSPSQAQLNRLSAQLAILSALACAGIFGVGMLHRRSVMDSVKSAISLGVAAIPEGLPTVATTALALGVREMRQHNVAVRNLDAVEALGSVTVFCLDKTGTLTENRMQVNTVYADGDRLAVSGMNWFRDGVALAPLESATRRRLLEALVLCNESVLQKNGDENCIEGTSTENALLQLAVDAGVDVSALRRRFPLLKTRYRSECRHYMVTHHRVGKRRLVVVKGNPAETLSLCKKIMVNDRPRVLSEALREELAQENERWAGEALRVLAVATVRVDEGENWQIKGLTWLGLAGMVDPLRDGMEEVVSRLQRAGIRTVMITGDQSPTAYAVGKQLNISGEEELRILDASQLDRLSPDLYDALARRTHVFARVSPSQKLEIVRTFQRHGDVVAMTGDGVNDGPALRAADVGVAMGGADHDAARSLSDVVLEDDRLATMNIAVRQGRTIHSNIRKALRFLLSTNFSEIEVMLVAAALGLAPPLNPMQLLWVNLVSDVFPGLALALEKPEADVMARPPRPRDESIIRRADLRRMIIESGVITGGTLGAYAWGLLRHGSGARASSLAFHTLTVAQLLHAFLCRSEDAGLYKQGRPRNHYLELALGLSLAAHAGIVLLPPLRRLLGLAPLGLADMPVFAAGTLVPLLINSRIKQPSPAAVRGGERTSEKSS